MDRAGRGGSRVRRDYTRLFDAARGNVRAWEAKNVK